MQFRILSDLHFQTLNDVKVFCSSYQGGSFPVVLAGDLVEVPTADNAPLLHLISFMSNNHSSVIYVFGNHEHWTHGLNAVETFRASIQHLKNVFLLENTSVTIDDVEFFGCTLWPDYKQANPAVLEYAQNVDENVRRVGVDVSMVQERQRQSVQSLRALVPNRKRIIITHYAPSCLSITDDFQCDEPLMQYLCYSEITDVCLLYTSPSPRD